jgi:DNA repair exonuclease SbcCD ATPase subunit
VEAVMDLLSKMVKDCGTIFVVTHHPGMKALFNKTINVIKENGQSRIE